ncbi:MAG: Mov34/MPN/PAD-1 family protein, partial [Candidatus Sericytochromatia bacterium]|nr:Mov34/MPN/PAD-1 family protein [Candidatus Tanganyikabacteria bacterium]
MPVEVAVRAAALAAARRHGDGSPGREVGGILYGRCVRRDDCYAVEICAALPARDAAGSAVHLVFTPAAWEHVFAGRAALEPDLEIVGWYHTHPGLGVFLSGTDRRTHATWFGRPWQVAMVLDPLADEAGLFSGSGEAIACRVVREAGETPALPGAGRTPALP